MFVSTLPSLMHVSPVPFAVRRNVSPAPRDMFRYDVCTTVQCRECLREGRGDGTFSQLVRVTLWFVLFAELYYGNQIVDGRNGMLVGKRKGNWLFRTYF